MHPTTYSGWRISQACVFLPLDLLPRNVLPAISSVNSSISKHGLGTKRKKKKKSLTTAFTLEDMTSWESSLCSSLTPNFRALGFTRQTPWLSGSFGGTPFYWEELKTFKTDEILRTHTNHWEVMAVGTVYFLCLRLTNHWSWSGDGEKRNFWPKTHKAACMELPLKGVRIDKWMLWVLSSLSGGGGWNGWLGIPAMKAKTWACLGADIVEKILVNLVEGDEIYYYWMKRAGRKEADLQNQGMASPINGSLIISVDWI